MFLEYRKNIKLVFDSIAQLHNDFVLSTVKGLVVDVASNWRLKSFIEIENVLYLLYLLSEAIPVSSVLAYKSTLSSHFIFQNRKIKWVLWHIF